jgi:hypothetical protein
MRCWNLLVLLAAAACGQGGVVTLGGPTSRYVVSAMRVPTNNMEGREFGLDLVGDGRHDNQLGMALATLIGNGVPVQQSIDKAIAEGDVILLAEIEGITETSGGLAAFTGFRTLFGANPQPPACDPGETYTCTAAMPPVCGGCGHHLTGAASFDVDASSPLHPPLLGALGAGALSASGGELSLALALGDPQQISLDLIGGHMQATFDASGTPTQILLGGGITNQDLNDGLVPAAQRAFTAIVLSDCCGAPTSPGGVTCDYNATPSCGCRDGSTGKTFLGVFDSDHDCSISVDEITHNSLVESLLAPDVIIDGTDALSIGVQVDVVPATF